MLLVHSRWCTHDRDDGAAIGPSVSSRHVFVLQPTVLLHRCRPQFGCPAALTWAQTCWCTRAGALMTAAAAQPARSQSESRRLLVIALDGVHCNGMFSGARRRCSAHSAAGARWCTQRFSQSAGTLSLFLHIAAGRSAGWPSLAGALQSDRYDGAAIGPSVSQQARCSCSFQLKLHRCRPRLTAGWPSLGRRPAGALALVHS